MCKPSKYINDICNECHPQSYDMTLAKFADQERIDPKEERLKELVGWLEVKGVELNQQDIKYFEGVISLARNDGYREATKVGNKLMREMMNFK